MSAAPLSPTARTAFKKPSVVHDHDWVKGLLMLMAACLAIGWLDANDNAVEARAAAERTLSQSDAALESAKRMIDAPQVRLEGSGYTCRAVKVRSEWIPAVMDSCRKLGELLRTARASE